MSKAYEMQLKTTLISERKFMADTVRAFADMFEQASPSSGYPYAMRKLAAGLDERAKNLETEE